MVNFGKDLGDSKWTQKSISASNCCPYSWILGSLISGFPGPEISKFSDFQVPRFPDGTKDAHIQP